jgi:predicted ester cyclase
MPSNKNLALVRRMVRDVWNLRDLDLADDFFSVDYVNHGGVIIDVVNGPESIKMTVELFRAAFPDFWVSIVDQRADGQRIIVRWTAHKNKPDPDRSGATVEIASSVSGHFICLVAGGRITESWTFWDKEAVIRSLGMRRAYRTAGMILDR